MTNKDIRVSVFGLGYVGCVSLAGLSSSGIYVTGVDVDSSKVEKVNSGLGTIYEPGLDELIKEGVDGGIISATTDIKDALRSSDIAVLTVGTPHLPSGNLDLSQIFSVCSEIGKFLCSEPKRLTVVIRSTVEPGTCKKVSSLLEKLSGLKASSDFFVVSNPEFLREGTAVSDYLSPGKIVIGSPDDFSRKLVASIYDDLKAEVKFVSHRSAEFIKYVNNSWHAVKVAFGNEIGAICHAQSLDTEEIMDLFLSDKVLNISDYYLTPGFPYGGACLPKDLSGLVSMAKGLELSTSLIANVKKSNDEHISRAIKTILKVASDKKLNLMGLSFKANTDDVRNSPAVQIAKELVGYGFCIKIFDENVLSSLRRGKNELLIRSIIGDLEVDIVESAEIMEEFSDVYVMAKQDKNVIEYMSSLRGKCVIDLVGWRGPLDRSNTIFSSVKSFNH